MSDRNPGPKGRRPEGATNRPNAVPGSTLRVRFSRTGAPSYLAHLDMMRLFERSLRRSGFPLAYTQGFNPHPVMTFALPLGVGVDSDDDCADFSLADPVEPEAFVRRMNEVLPDGLRLLEARIAPETGDSLMAAVHAAVYRLDSPGLGAAAAALPAQGALPVGKKGKEGVKTVDIRPMLLGVDILSPDSVRILVSAGSRENLRPDLYLQALVDHAGLPQEAADDAVILRAALYARGPDGSLKGLL